MLAGLEDLPQACTRLPLFYCHGRAINGGYRGGENDLVRFS